jgi:hypothetical protein
MAAAMSACGVTAITWVTALLAGNGSTVEDPAVPVMFTAPVAGAVKLTAQSMLCPTGRGFGAGLGVQFTVAPGGSPEGTHVGAAAGLGPAFVQLTVPATAEPAAGLDGKPLSVARISACGTGVVVADTFSLPGSGSGVAELATPVTVTAEPSSGAM